MRAAIVVQTLIQIEAQDSSSIIRFMCIRIYFKTISFLFSQSVCFLICGLISISTLEKPFNLRDISLSIEARPIEAHECAYVRIPNSITSSSFGMNFRLAKNLQTPPLGC